MKRLFVCILCVALLLTGCGIEIKQSSNKDKTNGKDIVSGETNAQTKEGSEKVSGNTAVSGDAVDFDISSYDGDWYDKSFKEFRYKDTGEVYNMGVWVSMDTKNSKVSIYDISSPPSNRVASVDTTYKINGSKAEFEFEDDGWGNAGYGTITFGNSDLAVDIVLTAESEDNWEIFSGMLVFGREKNVVEVNDEDMDEAGFSGDDTESGSSEVSGDSSEVAGYDASGMIIRLGGKAFDIEYPIVYKDLVNLTADELGILRNAIFAKYGYKFKTEKYKEYFSGFDWYSPISEDVNSKLTKNDKSNIALIQKVERFFSEKKVQLSEDEKKMTGFWHLGAGVGAGYSDRYKFYEDGTYKFIISQMVMDERDIAHAGKWFVLDGSLYLRVEREGVLVGGELLDAQNPSSATDKEIIGGKYKVQTLDTYKAVVRKLDFNSSKIDKDYGPEGVLIDTLDFYRLSPHPYDYDDGYEI